MPKIAILADLLGPGHVEQFYGHPEFNMFILTGQSEDLYRLYRTQSIDHITHHDFRRRSTSCNANNLHVMQPLSLDFTAIGDQVGGNARFDTNLTKAVRIRAVLCANNKNNIDQLGQFEQGCLAVLCRIADILRTRSYHVLETPEQRRNDPLSIVDAKRGLRHIGDRRVVRQVKPLNVLFRLYENYGTRNLT